MCSGETTEKGVVVGDADWSPGTSDRRQIASTWRANIGFKQSDALDVSVAREGDTVRVTFVIKGESWVKTLLGVPAGRELRFYSARLNAAGGPASSDPPTSITSTCSLPQPGSSTAAPASPPHRGPSGATQEPRELFPAEGWHTPRTQRRVDRAADRFVQVDAAVMGFLFDVAALGMGLCVVASFVAGPRLI